MGAGRLYPSTFYFGKQSFPLSNSNWASEASPTLGCSIEISRDIYMYVGMYVCRGPKSVGGNTWAKRAHAQSQYCATSNTGIINFDYTL